LKNFKQFTKKIITVAVLLLIACTAASAAESLEDFEKSLLKYQRNPLARAEQLKKFGYDAVAAEDVTIKQLNIPIGEVMLLESSTANAMKNYLSIYYIQKQDTTADTTVIDQDTLTELMQQTAPYTLLYYLELIDQAEKCRIVIKQRETYIQNYQENLKRCKKERESLESAYRVCNDKINTGTKDLLKESWTLELIKAQIEECISSEHYYDMAIASRQSSINEVKAKQAVLEALVNKIRPQISFNQDDYRYLDKYVQSNIADLLNTMDTLNKRYDNLSELRKSGEKPTAFTKFCYASEQTLIENEVLVLLNVAENWASMRSVVRMLQDIITGKIDDKQRQQYVIDHIDNFIKDTYVDQEYCVHQLSKINAVQRSAESLFGKDSITLTPGDIQLRNEFFENTEQYRRRMTTYLFTLISMRNRYQDFKHEVDYVYGNRKEDTLKKLKAFAHRIIALRDFELWHFEEYPITLGRLIIAILIMCMGNFIAFNINIVVKRNMKKKHIADKHTILLITTAVKYLILGIAFLIALSSLRIPFKAFAFAGGAFAVAFGFGAQTLMSDIFCGFSLLAKNRIRVGDHITLNGNYGIVKEITLRDTVLIAEDSKDLIIPNRKFFSDEFVNLTLTNPIIRTGVAVGISYGSDVSYAEKLILDVLDHSIYVVTEPYRRVLFNKFDDSSLGLLIQFFMDISKYSQFEVQSNVRQEILDAFRKNNIEISYPQLDLHFDKDKEPKLG